MEKPPRVLISYSHETEEHRARVLALAQQLRADGVDAWLDRFVAPPAEGWSRWMERHLKEVDRIIIVCTPTYFNRATRNAPEGVGLGVSWEWHLVRKEVYETRGEAARLVPVFFDADGFRSIPAEVWDRPRHDISQLEGSGYSSLLNDLYRRSEVSPVVLGVTRLRTWLQSEPVRSDGSFSKTEPLQQSGSDTSTQTIHKIITLERLNYAMTYFGYSVWATVLLIAFLAANQFLAVRSPALELMAIMSATLTAGKCEFDSELSRALPPHTAAVVRSYAGVVSVGFLGLCIAFPVLQGDPIGRQAYNAVFFIIVAFPPTLITSVLLFLQPLRPPAAGRH